MPPPHLQLNPPPYQQSTSQQFNHIYPTVIRTAPIPLYAYQSGNNQPTYIHLDPMPQFNIAQPVTISSLATLLASAVSTIVAQNLNQQTINQNNTSMMETITHKLNEICNRVNIQPLDHTNRSMDMDQPINEFIQAADETLQAITQQLDDTQPTTQPTKLDDEQYNKLIHTIKQGNNEPVSSKPTFPSSATPTIKADAEPPYTIPFSKINSPVYQPPTSTTNLSGTIDNPIDPTNTETRPDVNDQLYRIALNVNGYFEMAEVKDDGNCFYSCIAYATQSNLNLYSSVRKEIMKELKNYLDKPANKEKWRTHCSGVLEVPKQTSNLFGDYLQQAKQDKAWATSLEIHIAVAHYHLHINVVEPTDNQNRVHNKLYNVDADGIPSPAVRTVYLSHHNRNHYNLLGILTMPHPSHLI